MVYHVYREERSALLLVVPMYFAENTVKVYHYAGNSPKVCHYAGRYRLAQRLTTAIDLKEIRQKGCPYAEDTVFPMDAEESTSKGCPYAGELAKGVQQHRGTRRGPLTLGDTQRGSPTLGKTKDVH